MDQRAWPLRQVALLALLFGLSGLAGTIVVSTASLVGLELAPNPRLATLPVALALLGGMAITYPASQVMARRGRRTGFVLGTTIAAAGATLCAAAIWVRSFPLFALGSFLLGGLGGVASYYRFAAMDLVGPAHRGRAVSTVLLGGIFAGLVGPPLGHAAADLWPDHHLAGGFAVMVAVDALILLILPFAALAKPAPTATQNLAAPAHAVPPAPARPLRSNPAFWAAVVASVTAFGAMVLTMVAAPLSLAHVGHPDATAWVIQAHVVAMYVPALVSGRLVERLGTGRVMAAGLVALAACVAVNLTGLDVPHHWVALVLLGVGWNLLFVAGTAHLARSHDEASKARVQGLNDLLVASTGAAAALSAGVLFEAVRWRGLNVLVAAMLGASATTLLLLLRRRQSTPEPAPATSAP